VQGGKPEAVVGGGIGPVAQEGEEEIGLVVLGRGVDGGVAEVVALLDEG
jgi:hypothetical protein